MEAFGFWIFLSVVFICESWLFSKGYNSWFHKHKTDEEKRLREAIIKKAEKE